MSDSNAPDTLVHPSRTRRFIWLRLLISIGPGLMVMLADTDAGSVITAAQSGAQWGFRMIIPQIILIPILYLVQEMTVRLGIATRKGHGELIRERFGVPAAILSVTTLFIASVGALVTEYAGISGVGQLFGIPPWVSVLTASIFLILLGITGSYKHVERVGIAVGLFELLFIPAALLAHPTFHEMISGLTSFPIQNRSYMYLLAANVGAVIMPWMVFYQQAAVIDKGLSHNQMKAARWDTLGGSILTQIIVIAIIVMMAATLGRTNPGQSLANVQEIAQGLVPFIGYTGATIVFGLGMVGASFIAALVVSMAGAYGIGEAFGINHSLNHQFKDAKLFYIIYGIAHLGAATLVLVSTNLIRLNVDVEVMNAILLPIVLGFLLALEAKALPEECRMHGWYKYTVWAVTAIVIAFGLYMTFSLLFT